MTAAAEAHAASLLALFPTASYSATTPQDPSSAVPSPSSARTPSAETARRLKKHRICQVSACLLRRTAALATPCCVLPLRAFGLIEKE